MKCDSRLLIDLYPWLFYKSCHHAKGQIHSKFQAGKSLAREYLPFLVHS